MPEFAGTGTTGKTSGRRAEAFGRAGLLSLGSPDA